MKFLPLIWSALLRRRARTLLTLLSIMAAFLLYGLLEGINSGYATVIERQYLDRLFTDPRVPGGAPMPLSAADRIRGVSGVTKVCARAAFFGYYQEPKNGVFALATDASDFLSVRPEFQMDPRQLTAFESQRAAIAMTPALLDRLQLEVGDRIPIRSPILQRNGSDVWTFDIVASFEYAERPATAQLALINYAYFDEARVNDRGTVDRIISRIVDPSRSAQTAALIDGLFANSASETRTQNEKEQAESSIRQVGDVRFFTNAIMAAALFALLFVTGNTMAQSVRERIPEFAVLRTLGFPPLGILGLILLESLLVSLAAAALGMALASAMHPQLREVVGVASISVQLVLGGFALAFAVGLASAIVPGRRAMRLSIVDALRVR